MRRLSVCLVALFLTGCKMPGMILPVIGKPHFGPVTTNVYHGPVEQVASPWQYYFWLAIMGAVLIFTPLGGLLISRLRKWKTAFIQTARGIDEAGDPGLIMELRNKHTPETKDLVRGLKAKGRI